MTEPVPYSADRSLFGKLRRRVSKAVSRKPAQARLSRPLLTLSFDDTPVSSADIGAQILERHGVRGTYFISAGLMGSESHLGHYAEAPHLRALADAGHEIACHTFSHLDCGRASGTEIAADIDRNQTALAALGLPPSTTFAYPYGDVSPQAKRVLKDRYSAARALHHGLVTPGTDLNQTPAVGIEGEDGERIAADWVDRAKAQTAWLILYTHDVREHPSTWGCTPEALERLLTKALGLDFDVVTFAEGARRVYAPA